MLLQALDLSSCFQTCRCKTTDELRSVLTSAAFAAFGQPAAPFAAFLLQRSFASTGLGGLKWTRTTDLALIRRAL